MIGLKKEHKKKKKKDVVEAISMSLCLFEAFFSLTTPLPPAEPHSMRNPSPPVFHLSVDPGSFFLAHKLPEVSLC